MLSIVTSTSQKLKFISEKADNNNKETNRKGI